jgi:hypothetical protein
LVLPAFTKTASTPMFELQSNEPGVPLLEFWKFVIVTLSVPSPNVPLPGGSTFNSVQPALKSPQVGLPELIGVGVTDAAWTLGAKAESASIAAADSQPAVRRSPPRRRAEVDRAVIGRVPKL